MRQAKAQALALVLLALLPRGALAQSDHNCSDMDGGPGSAFAEGSNGVFFRIDPDLHLFHPFSDTMADQVAELSEALATRGTTLVYVAVPTRGLAMPDALPPLALDLGFDLQTADTLYLDRLERLRERGVIAPDARLALRAGPEEPPSFFPADPRLTPDGARRVAQSIAATLDEVPAIAALPRTVWRTQEIGTVILASAMRDAIQTHCLSEIPALESRAETTTQVGAAPAAGAELFGGTSAPVLILGTEVTGEASSNLTGALSEASGLEVQHYYVVGGGSLAAMSSYLTSRTFEAAPPVVLVWLDPVQGDLAARGDQPMAELVSAAKGQCTTSLPTRPGMDPSILMADLSGLVVTEGATLLLDADGVAAQAATFRFQGNDGQTRTRSVLRSPMQVPTGRFFMPLTGLWPDGARRVEVGLDAPFGPAPRLLLCQG